MCVLTVCVFTVCAYYVCLLCLLCLVCLLCSLCLLRFQAPGYNDVSMALLAKAVGIAPEPTGKRCGKLRQFRMTCRPRPAAATDQAEQQEAARPPHCSESSVTSLAI